jgi:hypothetical protein
MNDDDIALLRQAIALSRSAVTNGNHPFGALLADAGGRVVLIAENTVVTERDITGPATLRRRARIEPAAGRSPVARMRAGSTAWLCPIGPAVTHPSTVCP